MPREIITFQIGQCGTQIGMKFWETLLQEHAAVQVCQYRQQYDNESISSTSNREDIKRLPAYQPLYDDAMSSFFRNVEKRNISSNYDSAQYQSYPCKDLPLPLDGQPIALERPLARAVCVDMEEAVLSRMCRSPISSLFESSQFIRDVSGAGNNWAHGFFEYGDKYSQEAMEVCRRQLEHCESAQTVLFLRSSGGGTGSGLGSRLLGEVADYFPSLIRVDCPVLPSAGHSDVITAPYNALLSLRQSLCHADCVIPFDNMALELAQKEGQERLRASSRTTKMGESEEEITSRERTFEGINRSVSQVLASLTCSSRFHGDLNLDFSDLATNLVPFPRLNVLTAALSPLYQQGAIQNTERRNMEGKKTSFASPSIYSRDSLDIHFSQVLRPGPGSKVILSSLDSQIVLRKNPWSEVREKSGNTSKIKNEIDIRPRILSVDGIDYTDECLLAVSFIARGKNVSLGDAKKGLQRAVERLPIVPSVEKRVKLALCDAPILASWGNTPSWTKMDEIPVNNTSNNSTPIQSSSGYGVLMLSNDCAIRFTIQRLRESFQKLYRPRAHIHHFLQYCDISQFEDALEETGEVIRDYAKAHLDVQAKVVREVQRERGEDRKDGKDKREKLKRRTAPIW